MSAEAAIRSVLLADPQVGALVGTRVYPLLLPQNPTLPAIVYQRVSTIGGMGLDGAAPGCRARVTLSLWAETFDGARALARLICGDQDAVPPVPGVLVGYSGHTPQGDIQLVTLANAQDAHDDETQTFRVIADLYVFSKGVAA